MNALVLAAAICAAPSSPSEPTAPTAKVERLARFMVKINKKAKPYARLLAQRMIVESKRHKLALEFLVAIAWNESYFDVRARGTWYERGIWQLWPRSSWMMAAYEAYRFASRTEHAAKPTDWAKLTRAQRWALAMDHRVATYMASHILAKHKRRFCRRKLTPRCAARYNRPSSPRWGYTRAIRTRARVVRRALRSP